MAGRSTLPDSFAGGRFDLPLKVAKLVRLADGTDSLPEKQAVIRKLWQLGWFLDLAGVIWPRDAVPTYVQQHDQMYRFLEATL